MEFEPSKEDLQQLREWLQKMPHLVQDYDDNFLSAIIRGKKRSLQKAKDCLENINALGMTFPDLLNTYDPLYPPIQEAHQVWLIFPLPKKMPDGSMVMFTSLNSKADPSKSHITEMIKYIVFTVYVLAWENNFGSGQWRLVFDVEGLTFAHMKDATPLTVMRMMKAAGSNIPIRIHSSSNYNVPAVLEHFINLFKFAAKKKLADRIFVYSSIDKLKENIPEKMLPKEYGGCEESVTVLRDNWRRKVESYRERFLEEERKMRKLDPLRPKRNEDDQMIGTFRQLTVD